MENQTTFEEYEKQAMLHIPLTIPPVYDLPKRKRYGPTVEVRTQPKIGRNAPCKCGSGVKYKKCFRRFRGQTFTQHSGSGHQKCYLRKRNTMTLQTALKNANASDELLRWADGKGLKTVWHECQLPGWQIDIARACGATEQEISAAIAAKFEAVIHLHPDEYLEKGIRIHKRFAAGKITLEDARKKMGLIWSSARLPMSRLNDLAQEAGMFPQLAQIVRDVIPFETLRVPE